ncbi:MAG TPA: hypothetical protein VKE74_33605 [Gemmataceae bacterium]|nr:hypothetical protein [Gemmataceae bacterium]
MTKVELVREAGGMRFLVRYSEPVSQSTGQLLDGERLALAVLFTPGASADRPVERGHWNPQGAAFSIDGEDECECRLDLTRANAVALAATGFAWAEDAHRAAAELGPPDLGVEYVRHAIEVGHRELEQLRAEGRRLLRLLKN